MKYRITIKTLLGLTLRTVVVESDEDDDFLVADVVNDSQTQSLLDKREIDRMREMARRLAT